MKKIFVFSLVMLFMFFLTGCNGVYKVKDSEYHYFDDARIDNDYPQPKIITSESELIDYVTLKNYQLYYEELKEFNDKFFENRSLIVADWQTANLTDYYRVDSYEVVGNEIILDVVLKETGISFAMNYYIIIVEVKNSRIEGVDKITLNRNDSLYK